jgi:prepilin-type N-terminal cleavage/methylation domain-containing protein/prepilin-type processing-associated H-X9-DG protein
MDKHPSLTARQCDRCGAFDAVEVGDKFLCNNCITEAGCNCAGKDDVNNRDAFTLVELLVTIVIIAILAALLLPVISQSKKRAQQIQCVSNLHQLGIGLQVILTSDHGYPLFLENTNGSWIDQMEFEGFGESRSITNFIRNGVWHCPSVQQLKVDENYLPISYGYNFGGVVSVENADNNFGLGGQPSTHTPVKDSEVVNPSDMMAIGEVFRSRIRFTRDTVNGLTLLAYQRHQGKANVVFCDAHVESPTLQYLFEDTSDEALSRWNRDHQPHRDLLQP